MPPPSPTFPANPQRLTPYPNFRFKLSWPDQSGRMIYVAGFGRVSALNRSTQVIKHREGGDPSVTHLAPGQTEYSPITLERGVSYDPAFEIWANKLFYSKNTQSESNEATSLQDFRKNLRIEVYNEAGQIVLGYWVYNAWVSEYSATSELDANGGAVAVIETITVENEGWQRDDSIKPAGEPSFTMPSS